MIDENGEQLGVMETVQALALARTKGLDLIEVSPTAVPPVLFCTSRLLSTAYAIARRTRRSSSGCRDVFMIMPIVCG